MLPTLKALTTERVVSIRELQKNPSQSLKAITRIIRGAKPIGLFISQEHIEDFIEDMEALASRAYRASIRKARRDIAHGRTSTLAEVKRRYGV